MTDQVAARSGGLEIARLLVAAGAKRAMTDIRGNTALLLHCSGLGVNPAMLETLATNTVIDTSNWDGWWPLLAIVSGEKLKNEMIISKSLIYPLFTVHPDFSFFTLQHMNLFQKQKI